MSRPRLTQVFPFLLPLRKWQRKTCYYWKMKRDGNNYAQEKGDVLHYSIKKVVSPLINKNSGYDIRYQHNKVHNLKLAAKTLNLVLIRPGEVFSFWHLVRHADKEEPFKNGLYLLDDQIIPSYGGGLCQLSNLLFWIFLHTPLEILERSGHGVQNFPTIAEAFPYGTDATVNEGWIDLKMKNETNNTFQLKIDFDEEEMSVEILSKEPLKEAFTIFNPSVNYMKKGNKIYQIASVGRRTVNLKTKKESTKVLYENQCEIAYELPSDLWIEERG